MPRNYIKLFGLTFGLLSFLIAEAAPAPASLQIGIVQEWGNFNPVTLQLASNQALAPFVIRHLVARSADGGVLPDVAEAIPPMEKFVATWRLKASAKWGDGRPITCADWELGWRAGNNPNVSVEARTSYNKISKMEWLEKDNKLCKVTYTTPEWTYDRDLPPLLPAHLEKTIFTKHGNQAEGYDRHSLYVTRPTEKGLYNGPYVISEFKLGSHVTLIRNENYFGQKPEIAKVVIKHIGDATVLRAHLISQQINVVSAVGFPPDTAIALAQEFAKPGAELHVRFQDSAIFQGIFFNLERPALQDARVREALTRAIDKDTIVKSFFMSKLQRAEGILPPQHGAFSSLPAQYSKIKARRLLEEAGWKLNARGIREKDGQRLSLLYKTSAGIKILEILQTHVCSQFKDIGVECVIKNEPPRVLLGTSVPRGEFDLATFGQPIPPDSSLTNYFSTLHIPTDKNSWAGGNIIRLKDPETDRLLSAFDAEPERAKRDQLIVQLDKHLRDNYFLLPLYHRREASVFPARLLGVQNSYDATGFYSPETWTLQ